ncbi:hypothetical protein CVT26_010678 [Gymnopilus dilepis]|uniref:Ricin B lectin domain-containing protein n=1 Tax=Gymnopilus dilepis TaxID=231916 RepID=A0A409Y0T9_9AGAR|nr:hypothetical protein CVT26_010678 [Gymnopilus dilepis]
MSNSPQIVALPPGVYNIQISGQNVVNPNSNGGQLFVTTASGTEAKQQWLISGNGIMLAMDVGTYSYTDLSQGGTPQQVNRSNVNKIEWIITGVKASSTDSSFTGSIMTNDNSKRYWGLNGNNVQLQDAAATWTFVPA